MRTPQEVQQILRFKQIKDQWKQSMLNPTFYYMMKQYAEELYPHALSNFMHTFDERLASASLGDKFEPFLSFRPFPFGKYDPEKHYPMFLELGFHEFEKKNEIFSGSSSALAKEFFSDASPFSFFRPLFYLIDEKGWHIKNFQWSNKMNDPSEIAFFVSLQPKSFSHLHPHHHKLKSLETRRSRHETPIFYQKTIFQ